MFFVFRHRPSTVSEDKKITSTRVYRSAFTDNIHITSLEIWLESKILIFSQLRYEKTKGTYPETGELLTAPCPVPGLVHMLVLHPYQHLHVGEPLSSSWHGAGCKCVCLTRSRNLVEISSVRHCLFRVLLLLYFLKFIFLPMHILFFVSFFFFFFFCGPSFKYHLAHLHSCRYKDPLRGSNRQTLLVFSQPPCFCLSGWLVPCPDKPVWSHWLVRWKGANVGEGLRPKGAGGGGVGK